jgi:hypothetical protein
MRMLLPVAPLDVPEAGRDQTGLMRTTPLNPVAQVTDHGDVFCRMDDRRRRFGRMLGFGILGRTWWEDRGRAVNTGR